MNVLVKFRALPCRTVVLALGGVSLAALVFALISQFAFGYAPCELCLTQRWWHGLIALIAVAAFPNIRPRILLLLQTLAILTCFTFAIDHIGVEQHWWQGTQACVGPQSTGHSLEDLKNQILNTPVTRCDEPTWFFLGLSMACWNAILTFCMLLVALTRLVKTDAAPLPAG
jgi:disulfide bond formation protein DsbB